MDGEIRTCGTDVEAECEVEDGCRPVTRWGCRGTGAPPFLLKGGCNDEFAPPPLVPY